MMGWYGDGMGWLGWVVMTLSALAFWGLLVFGGIAVWRSLGRDGRSPASQGPTAEQLLDERFARGEIDEDEYAMRRGVLRERS